MKRIISMFILMASMAMIAIACGKKDDGGGAAAAPGPIASTPQPCNNQGNVGATGNCQAYQNYYNQSNTSSPSGWYYPQSYQPQVGFCGCSFGYQPVQGPFGVACAPTGYLASQSVVYFNVGFSGQAYWNSGQNNGWLNTPQQAYAAPVASSNNTCIQTTARGCDVRINNCPGGSRCQPVGGGSTIGLCTQ